jgi:thiol-disulfide isomerase/thioredoxin
MSGNVIMLNSTNVNPANGSLVGDLSKGTVYVLFYADWCGHCTRLKPQYQRKSKQSATNFGNNRFPYLLTAVDCTNRTTPNPVANLLSRNKYNQNYFPYIARYCNGVYHSTFDSTKDTLDSFIVPRC